MNLFYNKYYIIILTLLMFFSVNVKAQSDLDESKEKLPQMLGSNNAGKEFWISIPPCYEEVAGATNFIKIFITSPVKTLVTVEVPGKGYFRTKNTIPNDVIEYNITPVQGQPYNKSPRDVNVADAVFKGTGVHIFADQPLVVYVVVRYRYTSDGFLAYPVSSLGREYIVAGHKVDAMFRAVWNYRLPNVCTITAPYDDTKVRYTLGGNVLTKTAGGMKPGQTKEWTLMKGDVLAVSTDGDESDLSGSKIVSTKPVAVVTGNMCNNIPTGNQWCDYTVEMDIPTYTWGLDCHVGRVPNRKFSSIIKIFAKEPNTKIFRNGLNIGTIPQSGGIEGKGFLDMRMTSDRVPASVVISGDKPITVTLYNTGVQEDGTPAPNSDPFVMATTPVQQYQKEITFCTPGIMGGLGFNENYVNVIYETDSKGMMPDHVEFAGPIHGGAFSWVRMNVKFSGVDELFKYDVNGKKYARKTITLPGDGVYKIRSSTPFAAYSFGYSSYDSYGFPTAAALADLEKPDTVAPIPTWTKGCDGNIDDGFVTDMPEDKDIRSNLSMIVFHSDFSFNYEFKYDDFIPGDARSTMWTLNVTDPSKDARAVITFMDRRGNDTTVQIDYFATKLTIRPQFADFGTLKNGESKKLKFWVINESDQSSAIVKDLKLKSGVEGFKLLLGSLTLPLTLNKMDSAEFQVEFTASAEGTFRDSIGLGDECVFFYKSLVQAKVGNPIIFVDDVTFNKITVNTTEMKDFQIRNEGTVDLTITGFTGPDLSVYTHNLGLIDAANPLVIKPKDTKVFQLTFKPTTVGQFPDKITFISDAGTDRKNVCNIMGESMMPGLKANSYDWGSRRINKKYPPDNSEKVIVLSNDGNQDIRVTGINVLKDTKGSGFTFDRATLFGGVTVPKNGSVEFPVLFEPTTQGFHELVLEYENDFDIPTQTRLTGIGILPRLFTYNYDFDTTTIQVIAEKTTRRIVFKNLIYDTDTLSSDVATITDLTEAASADVSLDGTTFGPNAWTYNKSAITFPIVLQPGDSIEFDAYFVAQLPGPITASLKTTSDAEFEVTSNWNGYGVSDLIRGFGDTACTCLWSEITLQCFVENYGTTDINVTNIRLEPDLPYVSLKNPADALGFPLKMNTNPKPIEISYRPIKEGTDNMFLVVTSDAQGMEEIRIPVQVCAVGFSRQANIHTKVTPDNDNDGMPTPGEDNIEVSITFDGGSDISKTNVTSINMDLDYNGGIVKYAPNSAVIGAMVQGWTIDNITEDAKEGRLSLVVKSSSTPLNGSGEVIKLKLTTYLPTDKDITNKTRINVSASNSNITSKCLIIESDSTQITLDETCAYGMRSTLIFSPVNYSLSSVNPNPVSSNGAEINFGVGLDGYTSIGVYNSMGELVKTIVQGNIQKGAYQMPLNVEDMNSGMYWIRMTSGQFSEEKQLIIAK